MLSSQSSRVGPTFSGFPSVPEEECTALLLHIAHLVVKDEDLPQAWGRLGWWRNVMASAFHGRWVLLQKGDDFLLILEGARTQSHGWRPRKCYKAYYNQI